MCSVVTNTVAGTTVPALIERVPDPAGYADADSDRCRPGLRSRPSLSATKLLHYYVEHGQEVSVAGTTVPALIERKRNGGGVDRSAWPPVAGTTVPALIERTIRTYSLKRSRCCRRDYGPGPH